MNIEIKKYSEEFKNEWDNFVINESANGNVFHTQNYLCYHPKDRFNDCSIMLYNKNKLIAVIAAAKTEDGYFSHPGTSGGGPVISKKYYTMKNIIPIIDKIIEFYNNKISFRLMESFFSVKGNETILYYLYHKYNIYPELSVYKKLDDFEDKFLSIINSASRTAARKVHREGYEFQKTDKKEDYEIFYQLLVKNLEKHNTKPVHTFEEILKLKELLEEKQFLFIARDKTNKIVAATWVIKATSTVWHSQYLVKDYNVHENGLVDGLLTNCAEYAKNNGADILSFGISTENRGKYLNLGLISFKEHLGVNYQNRYLLEVK